MNYILVGTIVILVFGMLRGWFKGVIGEVANLIAIVLAVAGAALVMYLLDKGLNREFGNAIMAGMYLLIFIVFAQLVKVLLGLIKIFSKLPILNGINRFFGMLIGIAEGLLLVWVAYVIIDKYPPIDTDEFRNMFITNPFVKFLSDINPILKIMGH